MLIDVLVELASKNIDKTFTYHVNQDLAPFIKKGIRVLVPFNNQVLEGFVLNINSSQEEPNIKDIIDVVDFEPILNDELLNLGADLKRLTLSTLISCYQVMLPKALKARSRVNINKKYDVYVKLNDSNYIGNSKQNEIIALLKNNVIKKNDLNKISVSSVKTLLSKGIIEEVKEEVSRKKYEFTLKDKYELNEMQRNAFNSIKNSSNNIILLHGVTGSGKTEVYMELIEDAIKNNKTAIMLVPEISLTEQITERFLSRFGRNIAVLHSRLSDGEKYDEYRLIASGKVSIVIGARSAVFAPLKNIDYIIIDEEHTPSFKQDNNPKYSAFDVAKLRLKYHNAKIILGSATPTLESYARAIKGVYTLVEMKNRINNKPLPNIEIVDMNKEKRNNILSSVLQTEINERLKRHEQVILLLNRRGYSSIVSCKNCGNTIKCPNCDITLTYHKTSNTLRCHYCGYGTKLPNVCPECKEEAMTNVGIGTEKVEEKLNELFPSARIIRMDADTTSRKNAHAKIITSFLNHEYDILLGTQMIAKGLDFPLVTLVGVINTDTSLNIPDFRSCEATFELLSQASGRSGRSDREGSVILQTFNPDHYVLKYVKNHDYVGFFKEEMRLRHQLGYPPYFYITSIKVMSSNYDDARNSSNQVYSYLKENLSNTTILGPSIANPFRVNNVYRFQIMLKYKDDSSLYQVLESIQNHYKQNRKVKIDIDINPNHL